jgi:hypothetical protein
MFLSRNSENSTLEKRRYNAPETLPTLFQLNLLCASHLL